MPTYEYQCDACGHGFEELQSFSDPPLKKCPSCKKNKLRRLFGTGAAVLFKGSGFYETDYRSESYKAGEKAESQASKPADAKCDAKSGCDGEGACAAKAAKPTKSSGAKSGGGAGKAG